MKQQKDWSVWSLSVGVADAGYFVYDMLDMVVCQRTWQSLELVGHHVVVSDTGVCVYV